MKNETISILVPEVDPQMLVFGCGGAVGSFGGTAAMQLVKSLSDFH